MDNFYELFLDGKLNWTGREIICISIILTATVITLFVQQRRRELKLSQAISAFVFVVLLCLLFSYCVFTRMPQGKLSYNLEVFWSWKRALKGNVYLQQEIALNIVLLIPIGFLVPVIVNQKVAWWKGLLMGVLVSGCIEVLQLVTRRGLFEWDDIIHNSFGCMIGVVASSYVIRRKC